MPSQEIFTILACEELEHPTWTANGECEEKLSTDFIGVASSIELAYKAMRSKKNFIRGDKWHFCLIKSHLDGFSLDEQEVIERKISPASL